MKRKRKTTKKYGLTKTRMKNVRDQKTDLQSPANSDACISKRREGHRTAERIKVAWEKDPAQAQLLGKKKWRKEERVEIRGGGENILDHGRGFLKLGKNLKTRQGRWGFGVGV